MPVYVDTPRATAQGRLCHLWADNPRELADFARRLGAEVVKKWATKRAHFLLSDGERDKALAMGAEPRPGREFNGRR